MSEMQIQPCSEADLAGVRRLVDESEGLTHHTTYTYWVALNEWPDLFLVAKAGADIVGFTFGLRSAEHAERVFLWQIGVLSSHRRQHVAARLLRHFCTRATASGARELWITIQEQNFPSQALFRKLASGLNTTLNESGSTGDLGDLLEPETIYSIALSSRVVDKSFIHP
jgi:L-2,4-diaminobutyric acid acetyltransferase